MSRYAKQHERDLAHIRSLRMVIALLALLCIGLLWGWAQAPRDLTMHYPPDLRQGAVTGVDEVPEVTVYSFALYIFQQLHRWTQDGAKDYGENIFGLQHYFSDRFRAELLADLKVRAKAGELTGRTRSLAEIPDRGWEPGRVEVLGEGTWVVWLDVRIEEHVNALEVKDTNIRYPIRVRLHDVDPEKNPWGLVLDGFAQEPERLAQNHEAPPSALANHEEEGTQ